MGTSKAFKGSAGVLTLAGVTGPTDVVANLNGDASGWPNGSDGKAFVLAIEPRTENEERILCSTLAVGAPNTVQVITRGWDGTLAITHQSGVDVEHVLDADSVQDHNDHVYDPTRDDHAQYLTAARHDVAARHQFGDALAEPGTPRAVGIAGIGNDAGAGAAPAREDHTHALAALSVDETILADGAINRLAQFTTGEIAGPPWIGDTPPASPGVGQLWLRPGIAGPPVRPDIWSYYDGVTWQWLAAGEAVGAIASGSPVLHIANDGAYHTLTGLSAELDPFSMLSAGGTLTVPAWAPAEGWWEVRATVQYDSIADVTNAAYAFQLRIVAGALAQDVASGLDVAAHRTIMSGAVDVRLAPGATITAAVSNLAGSARDVDSAQRLSARLCGRTR